MSKLEYKPIAVQDECWGGTEKTPELVVLVKLEAIGSNRKHYKNDVIEFSNRYFLEDYIIENELKILPEKEFRASATDTAISIIKAMK